MSETLTAEILIKMKKELYSSIYNLKDSIDAATVKMTEMYGEDHYAIKRLMTYHEALDKQFDYATTIDALIVEKKFSEVAHVITKIVALADMIKFDAKSLLSSLQTGKDIIPEGTVWQ